MYLHLALSVHKLSFKIINFILGIFKPPPE